jgi:hypothetical protein
LLLVLNVFMSALALNSLLSHFCEI